MATIINPVTFTPPKKIAAAIKTYRTQIDKLDLQILDFINKRATLAAEIGKVKGEQGDDIFNPAREESGGDKYFFGSQYFAANYRNSRPAFRYAAAVLLDMIGGKDARFPYEQNSVTAAGELRDAHDPRLYRAGAGGLSPPKGGPRAAPGGEPVDRASGPTRAG